MDDKPLTVGSLAEQVRSKNAGPSAEANRNGAWPRATAGPQSRFRIRSRSGLARSRSHSRKLVTEARSRASVATCSAAR